MHLPAASTQHLPAISPLSAHIEMEVIVMGGVIIRAEHRSKTLAGAVVDDLKETPRPVIAVPVVLDRDPAAICQHKGRAIDSIADRKSVVQGKSVSVRVDIGGRPLIKKKNR